MRQFFFAVAVVALSATVSLAQETPATSPPPVSSPVIIGTTGTPSVEYAPAQSQRRGLFSRFRNRNNNTIYSPAPMMTVPMTGTTPMPPVAPQPMPMPGTKTDGSVKMPTPGIVTASGNLPPGTYTTTDGTIIQIGGSTSGSVMTADYTEPTSTRRGLFGRMRNR